MSTSNTAIYVHNYSKLRYDDQVTKEKFILIIRHQLGLNRAVSASSNCLFKDPPSCLRPFGLQFSIIFCKEKVGFSKTFPAFYGTRSSLPCTQEHTIGPRPKQVEPTPNPQPSDFKIDFNIILPFKPRSSNSCLPFKFPVSI